MRRCYRSYLFFCSSPPKAQPVEDQAAKAQVDPPLSADLPAAENNPEKEVQPDSPTPTDLVTAPDVTVTDPANLATSASECPPPKTSDPVDTAPVLAASPDPLDQLEQSVRLAPSLVEQVRARHLRQLQQAAQRVASSESSAAQAQSTIATLQQQISDLQRAVTTRDEINDCKFLLSCLCIHHGGLSS